MIEQDVHVDDNIPLKTVEEKLEPKEATLKTCLQKMEVKGDDHCAFFDVLKNES